MFVKLVKVWYFSITYHLSVTKLTLNKKYKTCNVISSIFAWVILTLSKGGLLLYLKFVLRHKRKWEKKYD